MDPEPLVILRGFFYACQFLSKTLLNFSYIDGIQSLNRSRMLKFEHFSDPDLIILESERYRCLKM